MTSPTAECNNRSMILATHLCRLRLAALAALAVAVLFAPAPAGAQADPTLSIVPESASVQSDATSFQTNIYVSRVTNETGLGGYDIYVNYNPSIVQAVSGTHSGFVENTENIVVCVSAYIDNTAGHIILSCVTVPLFVGNGPTAPDQQLLATVVFKPVAPGVSPLDLDSTALIDPNGTALAATLQGSQVSIVQPQSEPTTAPEATATDPPIAAPSATFTAAPVVATSAPAVIAPVSATATARARSTPRRGPETGDGVAATSGGSGSPPVALTIVAVLLAVSAMAGGAFLWRRRRRSLSP